MCLHHQPPFAKVECIHGTLDLSLLSSIQITFELSLHRSSIDQPLSSLDFTTQEMGFSWKRLCASLALLPLAGTTADGAANAVADPVKSFDFSKYCNSTKYDSMVSSPSGTECISSTQEWVGITDWFVTGKVVFDQFRNMYADPYLCKLKFMSDPSIDLGIGYELGRWGVQSLSGNSQTGWNVFIGDYAGSWSWIDSGVSLSNPGPVDMVKFFLEGDVCIKNLMIACNGGASNGLGDVAVSVGNGFWENFFGTRNLPWIHCGPDGTGVKLQQPTDVAFYFSPWSFSGDFDRFYTASSLRMGETLSSSSVGRCYSGPDKAAVIGMGTEYCTTNE